MEKGRKYVEKWETERSDSDPVGVFFLFKIKCPSRMANKVRLKRQKRPGEAREHGDFGCEKSGCVMFFQKSGQYVIRIQWAKEPTITLKVRLNDKKSY